MIDTSFLKGKELSLEEGMEEGMEKGMEKGVEKGARAKALEIARSLKAKGLSSKEITELTGLSLNDLEEV